MSGFSVFVDVETTAVTGRTISPSPVAAAAITASAAIATGAFVGGVALFAPVA